MGSIPGRSPGQGCPDCGHSIGQTEGMKTICLSLWDRLAFSLLIALSSACALLLSLTGQASAAWPGKDGLAVFAAWQKPDEEGAAVAEGLKTVRLGRPETLTQLTTDPTDGSPSVSPDGRWIVFTRYVASETARSRGTRIFVVDSEGGALRQVSNPPRGSEDHRPTFDGSGERILFSRSERNGERIFLMPFGGGPAQQLTSGRNVHDSSPAISPNGTQIVFARKRILRPATGEEGPLHIYSMRPNGSHPVDLTRELGPLGVAGEPDFSPDGKRITFSGEQVQRRPYS